MDIDDRGRQGGLSWNIFVLAVSETLRGREGFHVAPNIPERVATAAVQTYLGLDADELILAVYDPTLGAAAEGGCALTTRRLCWFDHDDASRRDSRSRDYADLPMIVELKGRISPRLGLGAGEEMSLRRIKRPTLAALAGVLSVLGRGARGDDPDSLVAASSLEKARWSIGSVVPYAKEVRLLDPPAYSIRDVARRTAPRVVVAPLLIFACVATFALMVISGVSPMEPTVDQLLDWGGNSGVMVAVDGNYWRLLTCVFLHVGFVHLLLNMVCLSLAGPLVERVYGSVGFAILYLLAGVGGSIASALWHPLVVGVGASGAIFGVIGALLAFLMLRRSAIPMTALKPLRTSTLLFVAYNLVPGFLSPRIDNAAHLGGLVVGFVSGLLMCRPWPVSHPTQGLRRQCILAVPLIAGLLGVGLWVGSEIRRSPEVTAINRQMMEAADSYNALVTWINPRLDRFDAISDESLAVSDRLDKTGGRDATARKRLEELILESDRLLSDTKGVIDANPEIEEIRRSLVTFVEEFVKVLKMRRRSIADPTDTSLVDGPEGYLVHLRRKNKAIDRYHSLDDDYVKRHELVEAPRGFAPR